MLIQIGAEDHEPQQYGLMVTVRSKNDPVWRMLVRLSESLKAESGVEDAWVSEYHRDRSPA